MIKKRKYVFRMLSGENWWGGASFDGVKMPFNSASIYERCLDPNTTMNQAAPLLVSDQGRYIWCDAGFDIVIKDGIISLACAKGEPKLYEGYGTLRGAYLAAAKEHFPPINERPPDEFFIKPQFNTWIEMTYYQSQAEIERYAENLIAAGYEAGIFMIDCGWAPYYGKWKFNAETFPDPKRLIDKLHGYGFKVMLWTCPFITADTLEYRYLRDKGLLITDKTGSPVLLQWWDGFSAVLDLTNPEAEEWYLAQNHWLMQEYGIDGFKMDAGDAFFYQDEHFTFKGTDANGQSEIWARHALHYRYNELRACWKNGNQPLVQRLCDKLHQWGYNGVQSLVPCALAQGIIGCAYNCPDMIGGGDYIDFSHERMKNLDRELFIRYAQNAALMPMMQFSAAPWRVLNKADNKLCLEMAKLHEKFAKVILKLADESKETGEPIIRYMEYVFPHSGMASCIDQFMLGNEILVAPVYLPGEISRTVVLPKGRWKYVDGAIYDGGKDVIVDAPINVLPYFIKIG